MDYDEYMEKNSPVIKIDTDIETRVRYLMLSDKDKTEIRNMLIYEINHRYKGVGKCGNI